MDPKLEPIIVVDKEDNQIEVLPRKEAEADTTKIIRMVYILLFDDNGEILVQRRHADLDRFPNYWTVSATGAVFPKEDYAQAAARKLNDELGVKVPLFEQHKEILRVPEKAYRMTTIFVGKIQDSSMVKFNTEKVSELRWLKSDEAVKGYLLTPASTTVLKWWGEKGEEIRKEIEAKYA